MAMRLGHEASVVVVIVDEGDVKVLVMIGECLGKMHHWIDLSMHWVGNEEGTRSLTTTTMRG